MLRKGEATTGPASDAQVHDLHLLHCPGQEVPIAYHDHLCRAAARASILRLPDQKRPSGEAGVALREPASFMMSARTPLS